MKIGDRVKLKDNATFKDFADNYHYGCGSDFLNFVNDNSKAIRNNGLFEVGGLNTARTFNVKGSQYLLPREVFEVVDVPIEEMTLEEVCKELGREIKIIK